MALPLIYSFRSVAVRKGSSAMAVLGIALVMLVFVTPGGTRELCRTVRFREVRVVQPVSNWIARVRP